MSIDHGGARVRALFDSAVVWDNHGCLPLRHDSAFLPQLERYRDAGVNVVSINVGFGTMSWHEHVAILTFMREWLARSPCKFRLLNTVHDVYRCKAEGTLGIVFDVEGMYPVQDDLSRLRVLYDLGVRWMLIAYNRSNRAGGGCLEIDSGLTAVGRSCIDQMERLGMVLCLSHCGARTAAEALDYSRNPAIFSHSNPSALTPHARNVSNELMLHCARKGGVIGLSGFGPFLGPGSDLVERLLAQIRYVIDLVGCEHVGLGLDYVFDRTELEAYVQQSPNLFPGCGGAAMIEPEALASVAEGLARASLTDDQISGILGGNWLRIATQVWR